MTIMRRRVLVSAMVHKTIHDLVSVGHCVDLIEKSE